MKVNKRKLKQISLPVISIFFLLAGLNHFLNPDFYYPLIPPYLPWPVEINLFSGGVEALLGFGLLIPALKRVSAYTITAMLLAFIPSHIYFIRIGGCIEGGLCAPLWVAWLRLLFFQPLFMCWAWWHRH